MKKLALPVIMTLFVTSACWPFSNNGELSSMQLRRISGHVRVIRAGDTIEVGDKEALQVGDVVETVRGSSAKLRLAGARFAYLDGASRVRIASATSLQGPLARGSVLAVARDPMKIGFGGIRVTASDATFRIDQSAASARAASYSGTVRLSTPGQPRVTVGRLFEMPTAGGDLGAPQPYQINDRDPWDHIYLKSVVNLDQQLTPLVTGLQRQLGKQRPGLPYFRALAGGSNVSFMHPYLHRRTADLLTAFETALHTHGAKLSSSFKRAFKLFDGGARWAVVAAIMHARFDVLLAQIQKVIAGTGAVAAGSGGPATFTVAAAQSITRGGPVVAGGGGGGTSAKGGGGSGNPNPGGGGGGSGGGGVTSPKPSPKPTQSQCPPTDPRCLPPLFSPQPSPSPSGLLNGVVVP